MSWEMSIEVLDGPFAAGRWADAYGDVLVESALGHGAVDWRWHRRRWGVVLELRFVDEDAWQRFRLNPAVVAALDAVPDGVSGLLIYRGWGGGSSAREPKRPRPIAGAGAAALPLPLPPFDDLDDWSGRWAPRELVGVRPRQLA
ncbi:MAG: hypothetical protein ACRD1K_17995 [Acidimicrobiales bacterium]